MHRLALRLVTVLAALTLSAMATPAVAGDKAFLWKLSDGPHVAYVLGSLHVGNAAMYPMPASVERAFKQAQVLAVEADIANPQATLTAMTLGLYADGDTLANHISPALAARLDKVLGRYGLTPALTANLRPFMAMSTLVMAEAMRLGYDPALGIDMHFLKRAGERNLPVVELESVTAQMELLASFSDAEQEALLRQTVDAIERDTMRADLASLVAAWQAGDARRLEQTVHASFRGDTQAQAVTMEKLNDRRNRAMATKVRGYLASGKPHFVVVGALHLVGNSGIIALLQKQGVRVEQW